jgi:hypothetical protein
MKPGKVTNILLLLIFLALVSNLLVPFLRAKEAAAVISSSDSIPPAVIAAQVDEQIAPDRLTAELASALRDIAAANKEIAAAILEHSRSNENIAYAIGKVAGEMRSQRSEQ